ncbi:MAG TPA: DNA translocase FtsK 4TM domain-containing protein, partial [Anaerolineales bacterium]|nr:DNA translocase FtsK 4TM domain-containing protein [Anaerolineales bacterium]
MPEYPRSPKRQYAQAEPPPASRNDWLERLSRFNLQFGRFLRDAAGVLLISFAIMSLLAVWEITEGALITPFAARLLLWFGWGGFLVLLGIGYLGYSLLRRDGSEVRWGRIVAMELASLLTLGLLAASNGNDLLRAEAGQDGGRLGWGLITLVWQSMGKVGGTFVILLLWILMVMTGFGLWEKLEAWLLHIAGEAPAVVLSTPTPDAVEHKDTSIEKNSIPRKKSQPMPAEFRTSFKSKDMKDEKSARAPARGEDLPPLQILLAESSVRADDRTINQTAGLIMKTLSEFGIPATVIGYRVGPAVTQFAVQPGFIKKPGTDEEDALQMKVRVAQIASLEKDIALALSAQRLRIEAPVPGKAYVGIEVPNTHSSVVRLKT